VLECVMLDRSISILELSLSLSLSHTHTHILVRLASLDSLDSFETHTHR
jgi:hypothetical protein